MKGLTIGRNITKSGDASYNKYLNDIRRYRPLNKKEERSLFERHQQGDEAAKDIIIKHNLLFVVSVAKTLHLSYRNLTVMDLVSLGNKGLLIAFDKYDISKGVKFISYAVWWIRHTISERASAENSTIECPQNVYLNQKKVWTHINRVNQLEQREMSESEIEYYVKSNNININSLADTLKEGVVSLDLMDSSGITYMDVIADTTLDAPDALFEDDGYLTLVNTMMEILTDRERDIIKMYHGLGGYSEMNLEEIGDELGITFERCRQIKRRALTKMFEAYKENKVYPVLRNR
jgi:RNA polymerase primary sigma factor